MATRKSSQHPLDRISATWKPNYSGARKPLVLLTDKEIGERFDVRDRADAITARNVARDVAVALVFAHGKARDLGPIASRQIRTKYDGGLFGEILRSPFEVGVWFENAGPLHEEDYKIFKGAEKNLTERAHYKSALFESYNSGVGVFHLEGVVWS